MGVFDAVEDVDDGEVLDGVGEAFAVGDGEAVVEVDVADELGAGFDGGLVVVDADDGCAGGAGDEDGGGGE